LATCFLEGRQIDGPSQVRLISVNTFDISIAYEKWLIALEPNLLSLLNIELLDVDADVDGGLIQAPALDGQAWEPVASFDLETVLV
jgi:hypothetical protein